MLMRGIYRRSGVQPFIVVWKKKKDIFLGLQKNIVMFLIMFSPSYPINRYYRQLIPHDVMTTSSLNMY